MKSNLFEDALSEVSHVQLAALQTAVTEVCEWLNLKMRTGRYSSGLALELGQHLIARTYNVHTIYDAIECLEGSSNRRSITKAAAPFKGAVLKGLWHKHHDQARFIPENLFLEISRRGAISDVLAPYIGRYVDEIADENIDNAILARLQFS